MLTCLQAIPNLPLPAVVNDTVAVHHADMRCYASSTAAAAAATGKPTCSGSSGSSDVAGSPTAVWSQLEQLLAGGDMPSTNWLEGAKQVCNSLPYACMHACFVQSSLFVTLLRNPTKHAHDIHSLRLQPGCTRQHAPQWGVLKKGLSNRQDKHSRAQPRTHENTRPTSQATVLFPFLLPRVPGA